MRILVVEDDAFMRTALQRVLTQAGHDVTQAFNATAAMDLLSSETFDVVLLDILLGPGTQTGWSVAGFMQAHERTRNVPIIVLSGLAPEEVRAGAHRYANLLSKAAIILGKPVDGDDLLNTIDRVCGLIKDTDVKDQDDES